LGAPEAAVARAIRKTVAEMHQLLTLMNAPKEVQEAFNTGVLPPGAVARFAKVPAEDQLAALQKVVETGAKRKGEVVAAVDAAETGGEYTPPPRAPKMLARNQVLRLTTHLGQLVNPSQRPQVGIPGAERPVPQEVRVAHAVARFFMGEREALDDFPTLKSEFEQVLAKR
jgi:hypothetical protein